MKRQIAIILVSPENPDNIGAVSRAMKNMGLTDLRLVNPPAGWKSKGKKLAMSAQDVLKSAKAYKNLSNAIADAGMVVGTTRRRGPRRGAFMDFQKGIEKIKRTSENQQTAILFGKESKGLDNRSLSRCDWVLSIPSDEAYPSLNLAQAVMVIAFSLYMENSQKLEIPSKVFRLCEKKEIEEVLACFEQALRALEYDKGKRLIERILNTFGGIFKRNGMLEPEAQMFKGLSRTILLKLKKAEEKNKKDDKIPLTKGTLWTAKA
jgi:TrmH family RNA methyltransferase